MVSPFAGFFYSSVRFEPFLGVLSSSSRTAWLDGFFLNHAVVTTSVVLEWQRELGTYVFALGVWGFLISAFQVYANKLLGRGVAKGLLYRVSRHPQYLCLEIAGLGLLTVWPRFLLLGFFVTMAFLYAGLARFEEWRMQERFGDSYRIFMRSRGAFLPGSPLRRLFEATLGRLRPRALGWGLAYAFCLALAFGAGAGLRAYTRSQTVIVERPQNGAVVVSAWPQSEEWVAGIFDAALSDRGVAERLRQRGEAPIVATILPARYVMKGMYYRMPEAGAGARPPGFAGTVQRLAGIALRFLFPVKGVTRSTTFMGVDPDESSDPVEVVFSRAEKPYGGALALDEALDPDVRLTPLVVVDVSPESRAVSDVRVPLPQNRWGPQVVMPVF